MSEIEFAPDLPRVTAARQTDWLIDAADLLAEPDPGPMRWLVDGLIPVGAIGFAVGRWKTTKSYGLMELAISIATGRPAFGVLEIPEPGPVIFVNEESGRAATWRRLDALCRGRAIDPEELRGRLHVSANARLKLDDPDWIARLVELGAELQPCLFIFDPLARMKAAARDENSQSEMATIIDNLRLLRDETGAATFAVQHKGHAGDHMRGSSDLESAWETRLTWKREGQSSTVEIENEHREAESSTPLSYRIAWDHETRSMRLVGLEDSTRAATAHNAILAYLADHPGASGRDVENAVGGRHELVRKILKQLEQAGTHHRAASQKRDAAGRTTTTKGWYPASQAASCLAPNDGARQGEESLAGVVRPLSVSLRGAQHGGAHHEATPDHDQDPADAPTLDELETLWAEREVGAT